jgi:hypothetical protein
MKLITKESRLGREVHALWYASVFWDSMKRRVGTTSINISTLLEFQPGWQFRAGAWKWKSGETLTVYSLHKVWNMLQGLSEYCVFCVSFDRRIVSHFPLFMASWNRATHFIFIDLIFDKDYKLRSSSLCDLCPPRHIYRADKSKLLGGFGII